MKLLAIFALICAFALLVSAVDDKKDGSLASFETELVDSADQPHSRVARGIHARRRIRRRRIARRRRRIHRRQRRLRKEYEERVEKELKEIHKLLSEKSAAPVPAKTE